MRPVLRLSLLLALAGAAPTVLQNNLSPTIHDDEWEAAARILDLANYSAGNATVTAEASSGEASEPRWCSSKNIDCDKRYARMCPVTCPK